MIKNIGQVIKLKIVRQICNHLFIIIFTVVGSHAPFYHSWKVCIIIVTFGCHGYPIAPPTHSLRVGDTALFIQDGYSNFLALTVDGRMYYLNHSSAERFRCDISSRGVYII